MSYSVHSSDSDLFLAKDAPAAALEALGPLLARQGCREPPEAL